MAALIAFGVGVACLCVGYAYGRIDAKPYGEYEITLRRHLYAWRLHLLSERIARFKRTRDELIRQHESDERRLKAVV
jgi:hypothetical protein